MVPKVGKEYVLFLYMVCCRQNIILHGSTTNIIHVLDGSNVRKAGTPPTEGHHGAPERILQTLTTLKYTTMGSGVGGDEY